VLNIPINLGTRVEGLVMGAFSSSWLESSLFKEVGGEDTHAFSSGLLLMRSYSIFIISLSSAYHQRRRLQYIYYLQTKVLLIV
jgi:hypothetical protein